MGKLYIKEYPIFLNISGLLFNLHGLQRMHPETPQKLVLYRNGVFGAKFYSDYPNLWCANL